MKNKCCALNVNQFSLNGFSKSTLRTLTSTRAHLAATIQMVTKTAVVTGSSSGIGLAAAKELTSKGWHVIIAARSFSKAEIAAKTEGLPVGSYTVMPLDLASLSSVRQFVAQLDSQPRQINALVCNAAVWYPRDTSPRLTADGYEEHVGTNHLAHFLLASLMVQKLKPADNYDPRIVFLGTDTHNPDSIAGKIPPQADLGDLSGLTGSDALRGGKCMIDGKAFDPTKAYKDSKACNVLTMKEMHKRFAAQGVTFSAIFPGCVAESPLFREKRDWFRFIFPLFQKYITKQYVPVSEAGRRVAAVVADELFCNSGFYWKWTGEWSQLESQPSPVQVTSEEGKAKRLFELSAALVGLNPTDLSPLSSGAREPAFVQ